MPIKRFLLTFINFYLFLVFSVYPQTVHADGKIVTRLNVATGVAYEDNYFLTADNEKSVSSYFIKPGIEFGYTTPKSNLLFNYVLDANWYDEEGSSPTGDLSSSDLNYVGHEMDFTGDTQITNHLNIKIEDTYILTRDPADLDDYSNEIIRNKYSKNILTPQLKYQFVERFSFGTGYRYTDIDYRNKLDGDDDSTENRGLCNFHYDLNDLNSLVLQYQYWDKDYKRMINPDYISQQAALTLNRELKYYKLSLSGGYQSRKFENNIQEEMSDFIWAIKLSADRPEMLFTLSQNINDTAVNNDYYLATRFNASIGHTFLEKLNVKLRGYYQYSDYKRDSNDRKDNTADISCKLTYLRNEILSIGLEAGVEVRDSSLQDNDYENVYTLIGIQLNYDLGSK